MNTPRTDEVCELLIGAPLNGHPLADLSRQLETELTEMRRALEGAAEELRLIRMKDSPAVYDPTLRIRIAAILEKTK